VFDYEIIPAEEKTLVIFRGDMDIDTMELIEEEILPSLKQYAHVEINFSEVPFVDSTGVGLLINLVQSLKEEFVKVKITNLSPQIAEIFNLLQIPDIIGRDVFEE
jgi:anti-anti-sigma factor